MNLHNNQTIKPAMKKFIYMYLCVSKKPLPILRGSKILHAETFTTKKAADGKIKRSLTADKGYSFDTSFYEHMLFTFQIN